MEKKVDRVKKHSSREFYIIELTDTTHVSDTETNQGVVTRVDIRDKKNYGPREINDRTEAEKIVNYLGAGKIIRIVSTSIELETRFYEETKSEVK